MKNLASKVIGLSLVLITTRCLAADDASPVITKTFAVSPGSQIDLDAERGDVEISTWNSNTVHVIVERSVSGGTESQGASLIKAHKVDFAQDGKSVTIAANSPKGANTWFSHSKLKLHVHFRLTVPEHFSANVITAGGNIKVADLIGAVDVRTSGGDLTLNKIQGAVEGHTSGGNISVNGCTEKLQVQTSGGNIVIKHFSGASAQLDTSGGNIEVADCTGKVQAKTSGGNISIEGFSGPSVYADTSGGTVKLDATTALEGDSWLRSSGGNMSARLPTTAALKLIAATDGGSVSCELPVVVEGKAQSSKLEGKVNGGGPLLSIKTSGGDIDIRARK